MEKATKKAPKKPTLEEVRAYARERGASDGEAEAFFDKYESNGWKASGRNIWNWKLLFDKLHDEKKVPQKNNASRGTEREDDLDAIFFKQYKKKHLAWASTPPASAEEVLDYAINIERLTVTPEEAEAFFDFFEIVGWTQDGEPIENWRRLFREYIAGEYKIPEITE